VTSVSLLAAIAGISPGRPCVNGIGIPLDIGAAAADNLPSEGIGCRGGIWRTAEVDGDAELRVPEIGPDGIEDGEGDVPVEAELVSCGGDGAPQGGAWKVIDALTVGIS
jgi:hypothetical protein